MLPFNSPVRRSAVVRGSCSVSKQYNEFLKELFELFSASENPFINDLVKFVYFVCVQPLLNNNGSVRQHSSCSESKNDAFFKLYLLKYLFLKNKLEAERAIARNFKNSNLIVNVLTKSNSGSLFDSVQSYSLFKITNFYHHHKLLSPKNHVPNEVFERSRKQSFSIEDKGFDVFVSVLVEDYTKSSKGYTQKTFQNCSEKECCVPLPENLDCSDDSFDFDDFVPNCEDDCKSFLMNRYFESFNPSIEDYRRMIISNDGVDNSVVFPEGNDNDSFYYAPESCNITDESPDSGFQLAGSKQGFDNPCFDGDPHESLLSYFSDSILEQSNYYIKMINTNWNRNMKGVSEEPRDEKKVSFRSDSELVTVRTFEAEDDGYRYSIYALNHLRFQNRIQEFEAIMAEFLTPEHRRNVVRRSNLEIFW